MNFKQLLNHIQAPNCIDDPKNIHRLETLAKPKKKMQIRLQCVNL